MAPSPARAQAAARPATTTTRARRYPMVGRVGLIGVGGGCRVGGGRSAVSEEVMRFASLPRLAPYASSLPGAGPAGRSRGALSWWDSRPWRTWQRSAQHRPAQPSQHGPRGSQPLPGWQRQRGELNPAWTPVAASGLSPCPCPGCSPERCQPHRSHRRSSPGGTKDPDSPCHSTGMRMPACVPQAAAPAGGRAAQREGVQGRGRPGRQRRPCPGSSTRGSSSANAPSDRAGKPGAPPPATPAGGPRR
jgi:hypothetical protein